MKLDKRYIEAFVSDDPVEAARRASKKIADERRRESEEAQRQADIVRSLSALIEKDETAGRAAVRAFLAFLDTND